MSCSSGGLRVGRWEHGDPPRRGKTESVDHVILGTGDGDQLGLMQLGITMKERHLSQPLRLIMEGIIIDQADGGRKADGCGEIPDGTD